MKRFFALVKNENIKTMKQTSYRVLLIIFAVIMIAIPIFSKVFNSLFSQNNFDVDYQWYLEMSEELQKEGYLAEAAKNRSYYEVGKYFEEAGIPKNSAKYNAYGPEYQTVYVLHGCTSGILAGEFSVTEAQSVYDSYDINYTEWCNQYFLNLELPESFDPDSWEEYDEKCREAAWETENIQKADKLFEEKLRELKNEMENFDLKSYYTQQAEHGVVMIKEAEEALAQEQKLLDADPKNEELQYSVEYQKAELESLKNQVRALWLAVEKCYDHDSWEYITADDVIISASLDLKQYVPISLEMFKEFYGDHMTEERYEEFTKSSQNSLKKARDAITLGFYSIENGIPLPGSLPEGSVKAAFRDQIGTIVSVTTLIMIVLAGSTLSSEYSSGTIRLLLIRPRKRSKILGSKIVSMLFLWFSAIVLALILSLILNMLLLGVGDLFVSDLDLNSDGTVCVTPAFVGTLKILGANVLSSSVLIFLALLLSSLVRRTALSVALPLILQTLIGVVQNILLVIIPEVKHLHFLVYTPLPYTDLTVFIKGNAAEEFLGNGMGSILNELFGTGTFEGFYPVLGAAYLAIFTALFIGFTFLSFTQQQIKN